MDEHEVEQLVKAQLKKKATETKRKRSIAFFALVGIVVTCFGYFAGNPNNELPQWVYDSGLDSDLVIVVGLGLLFVSILISVGNDE
jgi:hypothetical protein